MIPAAQAALDMTAWGAAYLFTSWLRQDFSFQMAPVGDVARFVTIAALVQVTVGLVLGLYQRRWRYGSFDEVAAVVRVALLTSFVMYILDDRFIKPQPVPESTPILGGFMGLVFMAGTRYVWRLVLERQKRPDAQAPGATRTLVFGGGEGGAQVITSMMRDPNSPYVPVGILDDDPRKRRLTINGVKVVGDRNTMRRAVTELEASALLIAIPSADAELVNEVTALAARTVPGLRVKVLPSVSELLSPAVGFGDIRDVSEADLLGRHVIRTDLEVISHYLRGKRVLVTGAGGSIGSELCRQIHEFSPAELMMLDRDESALHAVQLSLEGRALLDTPNLILADIRDAEQVQRVFAERRPEVVFHAAALKHLPLLEQHPAEAVKTNVWGTLNVLDASVRAGVERFVNISTDKAANPISVLGFSKRATERLAAYVARRAPVGTYLSVRFGNVLGSRGSVLTAFHAQIDNGGPVTVTDREVTRYFMTVKEAVQLVVQAGAIGDPGEVLVLDMGKPVRIADVAQRLIEQSGKSIRIAYTGLRPGEKLHEDLFGEGEADVRPRHPLISHVPVPPLDPGLALGVDPWLEAEKVVDVLSALAFLDQDDASAASTSHLLGPALRSAPVALDLVPRLAPVPAAGRIFLSPPHLGRDEKPLLDAAIASNWIAPVGPDLTAFEAEFAETVGVPHAVALSSGTAALHLALLNLGVGPGDPVVVPSFTFAATANAVVYCGAEPVFVDSEPATWNLDPVLLDELLSEAAAAGRLPKAVVTVDLYGLMPDYERVAEVCARHGVPIVEDAAEALGSSFGGRPAGGFGGQAVFSFNGNKIITTSGGGMLVTDREDWAERARHLSTQAREPAPHYEHRDIGFNYRMSNLLAALGRGQLRTLPERVARRRHLSMRYRELLGDLPGMAFMPEPAGQVGNCWLTCITIDPAQAPTDVQRVRLHLESLDIESRPLWKPMHLQPVFAARAARVSGVSERLFATGLCLPSGSSLTDDDQDRVVAAIRSTFGA